MNFDILEEPNDIKEPQEWVPFAEGVKFLVCGINKPSFQRALELVNRKSLSELNDVTLITDQSADDANHTLALALGWHLVSGWQGVCDTEGNKLERTKENVYKIFCRSKQAGDLFSFVIKEATRIQKEAIQKLADEVGKSQNTTDGKPNTPT